MMNPRKVPARLGLHHVALLVAIASAGGPACTDAGLYKLRSPAFLENKLSVSGTVCSDDPRQRNFPVKVLFLIDASQPLADESNDPIGYRGKAVRDVVELWGKFSNYSFGVIEYGPRVQSYVEGGFTRDTSILNAATDAIQGSRGACQAGVCRDMQGALSLASSIITGDVLASDAGDVARTSYVVILFAGGPPVPAIGRCGCRDPKTEPEDWPGNCAWSECDNCDVACPPGSICEGSQCFPTCDGRCEANEWCTLDGECVLAGTLPARPAVDNIGVVPERVPDTFTRWRLPNDVSKFGLDPALVTGAPCTDTCVYAAGGRADSCEERELTQLVREMRDFALANGAAQLQFHTAYLPDKATHVDGSPFKPYPCNCAGGGDCSGEADHARSVRLLSEMSYAGGGGFIEFGNAETISYRHVDLFTARDPLLIKELVVSNASVVPGPNGPEVDSDQDGLADSAEAQLGTCPVDPDSDGDGLNDTLEVKLAQDPLSANDPIECIDLLPASRTDEDLCPGAEGAEKTWKIYDDVDQDTLNACEERLLGTQDSLYDSDADGIPDKVEFVTGTNYLAVDPLSDADLDGILNREEIRGHTDPRANDAQEQLDLSYRYNQVDEGIRDVISVTQPPTITGVTVKAISAETPAGLGILRFSLDPVPSLQWKGPGDAVGAGDFGTPVDISRPTSAGYRVASRDETFLSVLVDGPDYYPPIDAEDRLVVSSAKKNCLNFRVRNITLMETREAWYTSPQGAFRSGRGDNTVYIYFAEAPAESKDGFGIFRVASVVLNYLQGPPEQRTPRKAELTFADDDFILFE